MKNKNIIIHVIQVLLIICFIISITPKEFQNDTFFTIVIGNRVLEHGVETEEHLVWHEGLEYTNSRWLFDAIIAIINNNFGYTGIYVFVMFIASLQGILYYYIVNKITKNKYISFLITLLIMYASRNAIAARSQVVSFLLFILEFYVIEKMLETNKNRYLVILSIIPLLLVNIHASVFPMYFVIFLPYIAEFILAKLKININENIVIENRNIKKLIIALILGIIFSFCTPKGVSPYTDMFKAMGGISIDIITELQPIDITEEFYFWMMLIISIFVMMFTKTKLKITDGFFILGFALMSLVTYRTIFFFYLISSIGIIRMLNDFIKENKPENIKINNKIKILIVTMIYISIGITSINRLYAKLIYDYVDTVNYPVNATNYILNNVDLENMKIYNHFNFGSYLELNGIKAFIDSRSGVFTEEFNPGTTILNDWWEISYGSTHYSKVFDKYNITHALLYNEELISIYIAEDEDWKLIYQDDKFSIYERVNEIEV